MMDLKSKLLHQLIEAVSSKNIDGVEAALAAGADPNGYLPYRMARPPMHEAAYGGFIKALDLVHAAGGSIDGSDNFESTPLMTAASHGQIEAARWLLQHGADLSIRSKDIQAKTALETALYHACWSGPGCLDVASMILQEYPGIRDNELFSAAQRTITIEHNAAVAQWLLKAGVSPNLVTQDGDPWLFQAQALTESSVDVTRLLLAAGADINLQNKAGRTALHRTIRLCSPPDFANLLRAGADPDIPDQDGESVRHMVNDPECQQLRDHSQMQDFFAGWEASSAAHQAMQIRSESARPL